MKIGNTPFPVLFSILAAVLLVVSCGGDSSDSTVSLKSVEPAVSLDEVKTITAAGAAPTLLSAEYNGEITLTWSSLLEGDYNVDAVVDGKDVFPIAAHFNQQSSFGGEEPDEEGNDCIDGNLDGIIDGKDLFTIAVHFMETADSYVVVYDKEEDGAFSNRMPEFLAYTGCHSTSSHSFFPEGLLPWWYAVANWNSSQGECGEISNPMLISPEEPPVPINLTATPSEVSPVSVELHWEEADGKQTQYFSLYARRSVPGPPWGEPIMYHSRNTSFVDLNVENHQTMFYAVRSEYYDGPASALTEPVMAETGDPPPIQPTGFKAVTDVDSAMLTWEPLEEFEDFSHYVLSYKRQQDPEPYIELETFAERTADSYLHADLVTETTYQYRLCSVDLAGQPSAFAELNCKPSAAPAAPVNLACTAISSKEIHLIWDPVDEADVTSYRIYRHLDTPGPPWERLASFRVIEGAEFTDWRSLPDQTWHYAVSAVDESDMESELSTSASGTALSQATSTLHEITLPLGDIGANPILRLDGQGVPWIACDGPDESVVLVTWTGGETCEAMTITPEGGGYTYADPSMAVNPVTGHPALTIESPNENLEYHEWNGSVWESEIPWEGFILSSSLVFDALGNPLISVEEMRDPPQFRSWVHLVTRDGGGWQGEYVLDTGPLVFMYQQMVLNDSENPLIFFCPQMLCYLFRDGDEWDDFSVPDTTYMGYELSVDVSVAGDIWVAHTSRDTEYQLYVSHLSDTEWTTDGIDGPWEDIDDPNIAVSPHGLPTLLLLETSDNRDCHLLLGRYISSTWTFETIETGLSYLTCIQDSLVYDRFGNMAFCYWNKDAGTITLSWWY